MTTMRSAKSTLLSVSRVWILTSLLIAVLVTVTSLFGILDGRTYARETASWAIQATGQDWANLGVVVLLLVSTYYMARHSLRGYLVWLSAFIYLIYAFAIYAFAVHFHTSPF